MLPNVLQPSATDHVPVLAAEVRESLAVEPGQTVVDATFGAGGHAALLAADLKGRGKLIAIDRDPGARAYFERFEKRAGVQARLLRGDFGVVLEQLADNGVRADAILLDLGVSSMQIDRPERGFSYSVDAPLDMRMDTTQGETAAAFLATAGIKEITEVIRNYGEERFAFQIAKKVVAAREERPLATTGQLAALVREAVRTREPGQDPATRTFQALRIHVNQDLEQLALVLPQAAHVLKRGGRLVVISFHSLEDRIVKRFMRDQAKADNLPKNLPLRSVDLPAPQLRLVGKPVKAADAEIALNPRARSAIMRVAEKQLLEAA
jgi:16S rRNA (cytosine1402-N4)-methyltransferase